MDILIRFDEAKKILKTSVDVNIEKLAKIWAECGYDEETIVQRIQAIMKYNEELYADMIAEEEENKNTLITKIEQYLKEAAQLNTELSVEIPVIGYENLPLKDVEQSLKNKLKHYRKVKEQRVAEFMVLHRREEAVCDQLGIPLQEFKCQVLSQQEMEDYDSYIRVKEKEQIRLFENFQQTKSRIIELMQNLERVPTLNFERLVVCQKDSDFKVTEENMSLLAEMLQRLEREQEETQAEVEDLRSKLTELWHRLHEDYAHRDNFLGANKGCTKSTLKALREEVRRCEELKRRHMKEFVNEIRKELKDWWDKCMIHDDERSNFVHFSSDCYTEDLLALHEMEVDKYRKFYQQNIDIFQLAAERQQLWKKMLELEEKAKVPERLFQNRGGQLLQEEKERRQIQKELPKVEKELLKHIATYEERNGEPIKFFGESVSEIIENQWLCHNSKKENQKKAKKVERTRLLEVESKLGAQKSSTKRKFGTTVTSPNPGTTSKIRRVETGKSSAVRRNLMFPRNQRQVTRRMLDVSNMTTYTDFQDCLEALNKEGTCRSSVLPGHCLRERNTPARMPSKLPTSAKKTPQLTPAKPPRKNLITSNIPQTPRSVSRNLRSATSSPYNKGVPTTPRLTAAKGRLPIII